MRRIARRFLMGLQWREDRGDVPAWVFIALMSAGLVTAIWFVADEQLTALFERAVSSIAQP